MMYSENETVHLLTKFGCNAGLSLSKLGLSKLGSDSI